MKYRVYTHSDNKDDVIDWLEEQNIEYGGVLWIFVNDVRIIYTGDDNQMMIDLFNEDDAALFKLVWC